MHVALAHPGRDPIELIGRTSLGHLQAPHYRDMLRRAGVALSDDDWRVDAQGLLDAGVFLFEDEPGLAGRLQAYRDAGVDEVALNVHGAGQTTRQILTEMHTVLTAADAPALAALS